MEFISQQNGVALNKRKERGHKSSFIRLARWSIMKKREYSNLDELVDEFLDSGSDSLIIDYHVKAMRGELPRSLLKAKNLRHLDISGRVEKIPFWLADLENRESLKIMECAGDANLLPHLGKLKNLKKLHLDFENDVLRIACFPGSIEES